MERGRCGLRGSKPKDISGQLFGRLTAVCPIGKTNFGNYIWLCQCECGGSVNLAQKRWRVTKSCGCLLIEMSTTHGHASRANKTPTYKSYIAMLARCGDPEHISFKYYGGKGITICARWKESFMNFLEDMGERPLGMTLDRLKNELSYCKENCKWSTAKEQANNRGNR